MWREINQFCFDNDKFQVTMKNSVYTRYLEIQHCFTWENSEIGMKIWYFHSHPGQGI